MHETILEVYMDEAMRRLSEEAGYPIFSDAPAVKALARALQEPAWEPPVGPMLVRAREIVARVYLDVGYSKGTAANIVDGKDDDFLAIQAALIALREGMGA